MGKNQKLKAEKRAAREAEKSKGWKIDIRPYTVRVIDMDEKGNVKMAHGKPVFKEDDFDVQGSLCDILFNADLRLTPTEALDAHDLADRIRAAKTHVVLDSREHAMVLRAYDALRGVNENMIGFLKRIRDAEEIQLSEVKDVAESKD